MSPRAGDRQDGWCTSADAFNSFGGPILLRLSIGDSSVPSAVWQELPLHLSHHGSRHLYRSVALLLVFKHVKLLPMMLSNEYDTHNLALSSTRCNALLTQLSPSGRLVGHGKRLRITYSNSAYPKKSSLVGKRFGGARGGMNSREPLHKGGIHEKVFRPFSATSPYR